MCPHNNMLRSTHIISNILFEKIVDECSKHNVSEIHLHNFGEPLLDGDLEDRIALVKQKCKTYVKIFTNGSLLTQDRIQKLLNSGIDEIKISVDGVTPKEFERIRRPLQWSVVSENIRNLIKARDDLGLKTKIYITCCTGYSAVTLLDFKVSFALGPTHNWGGQSDKCPPGKLIKCGRLWRTFTILVDGTVVRCHADVHGLYPLGNIHQQTIKEVWNSMAYNSIRDYHVKSEQLKLELCANCSQCRK
jgi:radical SAM protein with 4Fe4S-binding SPASM domain